MSECRTVKTWDMVPDFDPAADFDFPAHRRDGRHAVRLGLAGIRTIGVDTATRIVEERDRFDGQGRSRPYSDIPSLPYSDISDLVRRVGLTAAQVEALATAGTFDCFELSRREALWISGSAAQVRPGHLDGRQGSEQVPMLPDMNAAEQTMADLWSTGITTDSYPTMHIRDYLDSIGVVPAAKLRTVQNGSKVLVGGVVTHRQRPATANNVTFMNLEDETGMINIICSAGLWARYRRTARSSTLLIRGSLERSQGVTNVVAEKLEPLQLALRSMSRDFR